MSIKNRNFFDKLYALRSTTTIEKDPFISLGNQKLLYIKHVFSTGVTEWKSLFPKSKSGGPGGGGPDDHYPSSSVATSRAGTPPPPAKRGRSPSPTNTPRPHHNRKAPGQSNRLVSPDSSPSSRVPTSLAPWANGFAPRPQHDNPLPRVARGGGGGSLLDQMLEAQSTSSRASSPGSDDTVGPNHPSYQHQRIVIPIDPNEGSVGGSPPSSDSDRPSVTVPHSARKHVRLPMKYQDADQDDDTASEYSSVSAATTTANVTSFTSPATRSSFHVGRENPLLRMKRPSRGLPASPAANPNTVPLGSRVGSTSGRIPWSERDTSEASGSRGPGGFRWTQDSQPESSGPKAQGLQVGHHRSAYKTGQLTSRFEELRGLDPPPCHQYYLSGRCESGVQCKYDHTYILSRRDIENLGLLAKGLVCPTMLVYADIQKCARIPRCRKLEKDCIYSHRCPRGKGCVFGSECWFHDQQGRHLD
jgi:hypothetical protein